jgi:hypothetical protein
MRYAGRVRIVPRNGPTVALRGALPNVKEFAYAD